MRRCARRFPTGPSSIAAATACSAPAPRRCCARPRRGDVAVIKLLLEKGANPKAATRNGVNGIMMAANVDASEEDMTGRSKTQKDTIETITLLLAAGVDVNAADTQGRTAVHGAAHVGPDRRRQVPARRTAPSSTSRTSAGFTPLEAALGHGRRLRLRRRRPASCARTRPRRFASSWAWRPTTSRRRVPTRPRDPAVDATRRDD